VSADTRKSRRRKAPTVKEVIDQSSTSVTVKQNRRLPRLGFIGKFFSLIWLILKPVRKLLSWLMPRYFVNAWREVRLVTWPTRKETWRLTLAVFIFAIIFGALVAGVDKVIDEIFKKVVLR
jgi:preprotein translocase SecE subunit